MVRTTKQPIFFSVDYLKLSNLKEKEQEDQMWETHRQPLKTSLRAILSRLTEKIASPFL